MLFRSLPGERILDTCAAPGGKTTAIAADVEDRGLVVATDLRPRRLAVLAATVARIGATPVRLVRADVAAELPFRTTFDGVLVDAPCSGLGVIRRDPEIRWRRAEPDLERFAIAQTRLLEHASTAVRPGGRLVYATCSSEPEENERVVEDFLQRHPEFRSTDPRVGQPPVPLGLAAVLDDQGRLRTSPPDHGLDAFFAVRLDRAEAASSDFDDTRSPERCEA